MIATIILLVFNFLSLGYALAKHGEPKEENYNFWVELTVAIILMVLYYYAGLFDNFK